MLKDIPLKLKVIYLPFLATAIGTILFYNLVRWTFDIQLGILPLKEDLLNFWIPFVIPWIPITIWLRKRIRILNVRGPRDNGRLFIQFLMAMAIAAPIIISQRYIEKAAYELVTVDDASSIIDHEGEKYFKVRRFNIDRAESLPYVTARTSGKNNDWLTFYLYLACPFEDASNVWYGVEYHDQMNNHASEEKKDAIYRRFWQSSQSNFESYDFKHASYFEKLGYSDDRDGFLEAIADVNPAFSKENQVILIPKTKAFSQRLGNTFPWIFGSFGIGASVLLLLFIIPGINPEGLRDFNNNNPLREDELKVILELLDPRGPNKAVAILLLVNIIVFVIMVFAGVNIISPSSREMMEFGGHRRAEVMDGEYWRLLTSVFVHGGLMHLIMNLIGLGISAGLLVRILGTTRLLLSFIVTGVLASIASILWHEHTVSVGASGAIFGILGIILAFTVFKIFPKDQRGMTWLLLGLYGGVSLLMGLFGSIDNAAHIGGLISGFLIGTVLTLTAKEALIKRAN